MTDGWRTAELRPRQQLVDAGQDQVGEVFEVLALAGARQHADVEADARRAAHGEVVHGVADHGDLAGLDAERLAEAEDHARVRLRAEPGIAAHGEIEEVEDVVLRQRGLQAAGRSRWWQGRCRKPRRFSSTSVARAPSISTECWAPPAQKMRSMPATS